jgi:hypothetical protein
MILRLPLAAGLLLVAACAQMPRDPDGTLERVRAERQFRVGLISSGEHRDGDGREREFLVRIARATGARPLVTEGAAEPLLLQLEQGGVDLVLGTVAQDSPWMNRVAILEPVAELPGDPGRKVSPIARNGENAWITLLEHHARIANGSGG